MMTLVICQCRHSFTQKMKRTVVNPVIKDTAKILQTAEEAGGKLTDIEITQMPGERKPLHFH